jgi:hypothetical protein
VELAFTPPRQPSLPTLPADANQQGSRRNIVGGMPARLEPARVFPPSPRPAGQLRRNLLLGQVDLGKTGQGSSLKDN